MIGGDLDRSDGGDPSEDVGAIADQLGIGRFAVIGYSTGGMYTLAWGTLHGCN